MSFDTLNKINNRALPEQMMVYKAGFNVFKNLSILHTHHRED
jgi:hypothetical protein